jgi:hypothetical protein
MKFSFVKMDFFKVKPFAVRLKYYLVYGSFLSWRP